MYPDHYLQDSYLSKGQKNMDQLFTFPEVFLTLGAPGDNVVIPLSPVPGRPLSLNLNLIPKEDDKSTHCSSSRASPRKGHSRPPSPNPRAASGALPDTSCTHECLASPDEDCVSLIEKVHAAQLQKGVAQGGQKWKGEQRKGKRGGKKDKNDGHSKQ